MRILKSLLLAAIAAMPLQMLGYKYQYQTVEGDPMNTLMYELPNGLKVFMSVNKDQPRIQTNIAVRVGSKNDPPETTGLAHYFEHMMFKGTKDFGTSDYAAEKPMLDEIEALFETYRVTTDSAARAQLYHQIDSISYLASQIAIPNEYDKLMAAIGANGTNAYTSYDMTCYVEDIPSNELDRWAKIQANRFEYPVLRGFHTELETIYEEKNMSLTKDIRKVVNTMFGTLFPNHPYGQWTVLGHQTHLKNPSLTNIKNYHKQWYVPNNMAILMAGDFDPDNAIDIITKYFGGMQPNPNLPHLDKVEDIAITSPIKKEVYGTDAEMLLMAWAFPGITDKSVETLEIVDAMLVNGKAGLIDIDINNKQRALHMGGEIYGLADKSVYYIIAYPNEGQTLDDLRDLVLEEMAKLRAGEFDESLIPATINNYKLGQQRAIETNEGRVDVMEEVFINGYDPAEYAGKLDRQAKLTKKDITDFAKANLRDDNYVAIYKLQGTDPNELKIAKQPITPLAVNRDMTSPFLAEIISEDVAPIEPVFLDFNKDLDYLTLDNNIPVLYKQNTTNDIFKLTFVYDFGSLNDPELSLLGSYFPLLGTPGMSNDEISQKFYDIACSYRLSIGGNRSYVTISGLSENMPEALRLVEDIMSNAVADKDVYVKVAEQLIKERNDSKLNQSKNFGRLNNYVIYGPQVMKRITLTNDQITTADAKALTDKLAGFNDVEHSVIYYGPMDQKSFTKALNAGHKTSAQLAKAPARVTLPTQQPEETIFFIAPYDAKQLYMMEYANDGTIFDPAKENIRKMYNEYFGGGMNSIVFQEMREARSLAYSAGAYQSRPGFKGQPYMYIASIATQNDKMEDAIKGFEEIIEDMPLSEGAFSLAKQGLDSRLRTERIIKDEVAWELLDNRDMGIEGDSRQSMFEALPSMSLDDVVKYQKDNVKGRHYYIGILGDPDDIDLDALEKRGRVVLLTTDDIFFY